MINTGKGLNELINMEFIKPFLLGDREMGSLTTQSSESVSFKIRNRNKPELCLSDAETQCARLRLLPGKE